MKNNIDLQYWKNGMTIAGIDEAGRGPLAGPVVVAAVVLPVNCEISGINDSKKLNHKSREQLAKEIKEKADSYSVSIIDSHEIDEINILQATLKGMRQAYHSLDRKGDLVLIDGRDFPLDDANGQPVIKGDEKSSTIAAASILAKVTRDRLMLDMDKVYPSYGFSKHKGYATREHRQAIIRFGPSPIHRRSFLKNLQKENPQLNLFV